MPIIAYMGVPNDKTSDQNFKDFHDCGFNVSLYGYASLKQLIYACNVAQRYGVKILGHCPETHNTPEKAAAVLKENAGFFGYVLQDEPSANDMVIRQREINRLKKIDASHPFYINLLPYYDEWILDFTKTSTYGAYLDVADMMPCQQISFDYYPVTKKGLRDTWYYNLETIRKRSIKSKKPFWGFVLSTPHALYPQPTMGSLRLQIYTNLAYGAQAIEYFTYWTPEPYRENDFHNGPISRDGEKTDTYYLVQKMNQELKKVAPLFYGATVTSVNHLRVIPVGTKKLTVAPLNIKKISCNGKRGAIVSQFVKNSHKYLAVVNKDYTDSMKLHIEKKNDIPRKVNSDMSLQTILTDYKIPAGGIIIFQLK